MEMLNGSDESILILLMLVLVMLVLMMQINHDLEVAEMQSGDE